METSMCLIRAAFVTVIGLTACTSSEMEGTGITNAQRYTECLDHSAQCVKDAQCCSFKCADGACGKREP